MKYIVISKFDDDDDMFVCGTLCIFYRLPCYLVLVWHFTYSAKIASKSFENVAKFKLLWDDYSSEL